MAKSEILRRVANKEMDIETALKILLSVSKDIENREYETWAYNEINGYDQKLTLPSYRVIKAGKFCIQELMEKT